ncbi:MAG: lamin tail domain-containing protein [Balneolales bacterium]
MKRSVVLLVLMYALSESASSQNSVLFEDFQDGDFHQHSVWTGDRDDFVIVTEGDNELLRLDGSDSGGTAQLVTENNTAYGTWEFFLRLDNFSPTNSNRALIFLTADRSNLNGEVNGYALRTGENGLPKHFRIIRMDNGVQEPILTAVTEIGAGEYRVKVTREENGTWRLYTATGFDSTPLVENGTVTDTTYTKSTYFGMRVNYTATRRQHFFFDEIHIRNDIDAVQATTVQVINSRTLDVLFTDRIDETSVLPLHFTVNGTRVPSSAVLIDVNLVRLNFDLPLAEGPGTLAIEQVRDDRGHVINEHTRLEFSMQNPFQVEETIARDGDSLDIRFSEAVDPVSLQVQNFSIDGHTPPSTVAAANGDETVVRLYFDQTLLSGPYELQLSGIQARSGWDLAGGAAIPFIIFDEAGAGDVLVNEFMYRPPQDGPPAYVELKNNSEKFIDMRGWKLKDNTGKERRITSEIRLLPPGQHLVVTSDTSRLAGIFGPVFSVEMADFPSFNTSSPDDIRLFNAQDEPIDSLAYIPPEWGGDGVALERRSAQAPTASRYNWTESSHPLLGTPGRENTAVPVMGPPVLVDVRNEGETVLKLIFDREVREATPGSYHFIINNNLLVSAVSQPRPEEIELTLNASLSRGNDYAITYRGIASIFGEAAGHTSPFFYVESAGPGDVFINEFMYNPPGGSSRYIELFNAGAKALDMAGWTINNNTGQRSFITRTRTVLPPASYVILSAGEQQLETFPDISLVSMDSRFPALKLSGDDIVLKGADGLLLDSLAYLPDWGGKEVALERKTTGLPAYFKDNWGDSPAENDGTPGTQNKLLPDTDAPSILFFGVGSEEHLTIEFSRVPEYHGARDKNNYRLSPSLEIGSVELEKTRVTLNLASPLTAGLPYELVIRNIEDIFGNSINDEQFPFTWIPFQRPSEQDVVINEILYRPRTGGVQRYLELFNRSDKNFDLNHWEFGRSTGAPITLQGPVLHDGSFTPIPLLSREYLVLTAQAASLPEAPAHVLETSGFPPFSRLGDAVFLRDDHGNRIDSLHYQPGWGGNDDGSSLQRVHPDGASNDPFNWTGNADISAGSQNTSYRPDTIPPVIQYAAYTEDGHILVRFNKFITLGPQTVFSVRGEPLGRPDYDPFLANTLLLKFYGEINHHTDTYLEAENLVDFSRNMTPQTSHPVARLPRHGDIVINEIMHRPRTDRYSPLPDQSQYIELYNRRDYAVSMEGFFLHDRPGRDGQVDRRDPVSTTSAWIPARRYAVVYADTAQIFGHSRISKSFNLKNEVRFFRVNGNSLGLTVSGYAIYLSNLNGVVVDSVLYHDHWHNPNLADTRGISLERISPDGGSSNEHNWTSNAGMRGGSPGIVNSVSATVQTVQPNEGLLLEPNPFSPDGTGFDDHLFINYSLNEPDYLMRLRIFDRYGRTVRTLADGEAAGLNGHVIWDGRKDDQSNNRIGLYIILFEAYNSETGGNKTFREVVVLARNL